MADTTTDIYTPQLGTTVEGVMPIRWSVPMAASTTINDGVMVGINAAGLAIGSGFTASTKIVGYSDQQVSNLTGTSLPNTAKFSPNCSVIQGAFYFATAVSGADQILAANLGAPCYAIDNQTVGLTDGGGARPYAGIIRDVPAGGPYAGKVAVLLGVANPFSVTDPGAMSTAFKARAVATSIAANTGTGTGVLTGSANGAIGAQDGVTLNVGDVLLIPGNTTNVAAKDTGPWIVTATGSVSAKYVLTRPAWWAHLATIVESTSIDVGAEGTTWGLSTWRSGVTSTALIVDTNDPALYPRVQQVTGTLANGSIALTGLYIGPTAKFDPILNGAPVNPGFLRVSASATGTGTGTATVLSSSGTDTSPIALQIINF